LNHFIPVGKVQFGVGGVGELAQCVGDAEPASLDGVIGPEGDNGFETHKCPDWRRERRQVEQKIPVSLNFGG